MLLSKLILLETVDSTNNYIANLIKSDNIQHGTAILSYHQENGRGQRGSVWKSEPNKNIAFSIYLKHSFAQLEDANYLSYAVALSVYDFLKHYNITANIKWPNDLLVKNKKIAGVLIENQIVNSQWNSSIVGIGINVNQLFHEETSFYATSMTKLLNCEFNLESLAIQLSENLSHRYQQFKNKEFSLLTNSFHKAMWKIGEYVHAEIAGEQKTVRILGANSQGLLLLEVDEKEAAFDIKEVKFNPSKEL